MVTKNASRPVSCAAIALLLVLAGCAGLNRAPSANPALEQPNPVTAEWAIAGSGETLGIRWTLESQKGQTHRDVCARLHGIPSSTTVRSSEHCGKVGENFDFASVLVQAFTDDRGAGYILGITDPSVTEVRLTFAAGDPVRVEIDRQAFVVVVRDPFAVKSFAVFRHGTRLASYPCPDGRC